jgi:hypothetical protein
VWLLGIWQTGEAGRQVSLTQPEWQREYRELLPDFAPADVSGSPFAVREYVVNAEFGGPKALARFRGRLAERGVRLLLDFVPNHTALDHPWVHEHPGFYIGGDGTWPRAGQLPSGRHATRTTVLATAAIPTSPDGPIPSR